MSKWDKDYLDLCKRILSEGVRVENRTGIDTIKVPSHHFHFDLSEEFPVLTTKQLFIRQAVLEMLWFYQAQSNDVRWLQERDVHIWDEWEIAENGTCQERNISQIYHEKHPKEPTENFAHTIGTAYGWIVKKYHLIENLIETLKKNPGNRRMVLSLWQNEWLETAALPSCVWNSQWNLIDGHLNLLVTSRSSDVPLGLPFNIVQYATLCHLIAASVGATPGQFTFITNDAHIYENQIDGIKEQIARFEKAQESGTLPPPPTLWINPEIHDFYAFDNSRELRDIKLLNYNNLGTIKMPVTE